MLISFPCGKLKQLEYFELHRDIPTCKCLREQSHKTYQLGFFEPKNAMPFCCLAKKGLVVSVTHGCFCSGPVGYASLVTESVGGNQFMYVYVILPVCTLNI